MGIATTDALGFWRVCGLVPGSYWANETLKAGWSNANPNQLVSLECVNKTGVNFRNTPRLCISGYKYNVCNGLPLSGWQIEVFNSSTSALMGTATTNSTGYWQVCGLVPGDYIVYETLQPGWVPAGDPRHYVRLECDNVTGVNFVNTPLLCIEGRKTNNCDGDGLPGWEIILSNSSGIVSRNSTNATGYYRFCGLEPGLYQVCETLQPGWMAVGDTCQDVPLECDNATGVNFVNTPLLCISGYKLDNCDGALPGWTITLTNGSYTTSQTTDGNGKYQFCGLYPSPYTLSEDSKPGWRLVSAPSPVTLTCSNASFQNFTNQKLLCISGYKLDACTKAGLPGWTVTLSNGTYTVSKTTDVTGRYEFCGLMPGAYTVRETIRSGWIASTSPVLSLNLLCNANLTNQNFTNTKTLCISGYKKDSCNGLGLPGWTVTLSNGTYTVSKTTDGSGRYEFCGLMPGAYTVRETIKSGWIASTSPVLSLTLTCSANLTNQNFTNTKTLCISGYKLNNCTKAGISGWTITLSNGTYTVSQVTATKGKYEFCGLMPGDYTLTETIKSGWTAVSPSTLRVTLSCYANLTNQNFTNQRKYCIRGYKLDGCNNTGLSGWKITLTNGTVTRTDTTDANGLYSFCSLMPGTYTLTETLKSGWMPVSPSQITVGLGCSGDLNNQNFTNKKLMCISGYKLDNCDGALPGWTITLTNGSYTVSTTTDGNGKYQFCGLAPSTYTLSEARKPGWSLVSAPSPVTLTCSNATYQNFTNQKLMCISGYKLDNCDGALPGWTITLTNGSYTVSTTTNGNGKYEFCGLSPSTYTLSEARKPGWSLVSAPSPVTLTCSNATYQNFTNQKLLCISGYKLDNCDGALPGWTITLTNGSYTVSTTTDGNGKYQFCGLAPSTYTLSELRKPGWSLVSAPSPVTLVCSNATFQNFTNQKLMCISGYKLDNCDGALPGWTITLTNGSYTVSTTTDGSGKYQFCGLAPSTYTLSEIRQAGWIQVSAPSPVTLVCSNATFQNFTNQKLMCISGLKLNDCNGMGLEGWTVIVKDSSGVEVGRNTTVSDGRWIVCGLEPGNYYVEEVLKSGWRNVTSLKQNVVLGCNNATGITFRNTPLLCISGLKLNDCNGIGLDGWTVNVYDTGDNLKGTATTSDGGKWGVCGLVPGSYKVSEVLQPGWRNVTALTQNVVLGCNNATGITFRNTPLLCISGQKLDGCAAGLAGWPITLSSTSGYNAITVTDRDGQYKFCDLAPGEYQVCETPQPGWIPLGPTCRNVALSCENMTSIDFANARLLCIEGRKTDNRNGMGLSGWTITLNNSNNLEVARTTTNATGYYKFCDLVSDNYQVCEIMQPGWRPVTPSCRDVTAGCENRSGIDFVNTRLLCIEGRKVDDCSEEGLPGWRIDISNPNGGAYVAYTNDTGYFKFCNLVPGTWTVCEQVIDGWRNVTDKCVEVDLTNTNVTNLEFRNARLNCLSGYKLNERGDGLPGWTIEARNSAGNLVGSALTDSSGFWQICRLEPGTYEVSEVLHGNYKPVTPATVTVDLPRCNNLSSINFTNTLPGCIEGFKMDEKRRGLGGWTIQVTDSNGVSKEAVTDQFGFWQVCGLENGTYTVCEVLQPDWVRLSPADCYTVLMEGRNVTDLNFTNTLTQCISGRKIDTITGAGLGDWTITATDDSGRATSAVTNATGYWQICGLQKGNYTVCETLKPGWTQIDPKTPDGCYHITVGDVSITNLDFGNDPHGLCISGHKYRNSTGEGLAGWTITVSNATNQLTAVTNDTGYWQVCGLSSGPYTVCEELKAGWKQVSPVGGCHQITLVDVNLTGLDFYNERSELLCLSGHKYHSGTGAGLGGWTIQVTNASGTLTTTTDGTGYWQVCGLTDGDYTVCEVPQPDWVQAWPPEGCYKVTLKGSSNNSLDFKNGKVVSKVADKTTVQRGEEITYTITVCNPTFVPWRNVNITDIFSFPVEILSPVQTVGTKISWIVNEIPAETCMEFKVIARVPKVDTKFNMQQSVSGEGFVNVHNDYSTSLEGSALRNCVYVQVDKVTYSDCAVVGIGELGTQMMTKEHGSGQYVTEHELKYDSKNFSIEDKENVSAVYGPTKFQLPANRSIDYNTLWIKKYKAKNFITGASMNEEYTFATRINRDGSMKVDKNESIMDINSSFVGQAHLGFLKKAEPSAPAKSTPIFEMQEDYNGAFGIQEKVSEYGKNVESNKSATGVGYVAVDKRIRDTQRTYESGTGSYQVEEQIETPTSYIYKDLKVGSRPSSFSFTPRVKTSQDLLWSEGMISKSSDTTLRGGALMKGNNSCPVPKSSANASCTSGSSGDNRTVSYISERYSGIESMNKTTEARGLNEMSTEAAFKGTADYRAIMTGSNKTNEVNDEERYVGSYDIKRHVLLTGVSKYDVPHMTVTKDGKTVNRWYNGTNATIAVYTIHLTNDGNRALAPIQVMDRFPPGTEYVYSSIKPSSLGKTQANWTLTHMGIGDNVDIELELNVTDAGANGELLGDLVNRVDVCGSYSGGWVNAASYHVMPVNWLGCCSPELDLKKTAAVEQSDQTLIDYKIVLQNLAPYPMAVTVMDYLPDSLEIVEANQTPAKYGPGRAEWVFNTVPAGEVVTIDYVARALRDGPQINKVKVRGIAITGEGTASAEAEASVNVKGTGSQPYTVRYDGWQPPNWDFNTTEEGWYTGDVGASAEDEA
ncbi:MAG: hypothetical protein NTU95_01800 [Methanothrix sp.]|nr:hypothetical protein [Methanothrix sp.]